MSMLNSSVWRWLATSSLIAISLVASGSICGVGAVVAQSFPTGRPASNTLVAPPELCYAPGTPLEVVRRNAMRRQGLLSGLQSQGFQFTDNRRWSCTATNGCGLTQGQVTTLTWNIVPDGTPMGSFAGEPAAPSNLKAFLNGIYGNEATWIQQFQTVFNQWGALTGVTYVRETADDGTLLHGLGGQLGFRADIRIGGHFIDGDFNILAYNFFPNTGDMVIDTGDAYYSQDFTFSASLGFRNMLAHEHGHGLGFEHSCPIDQTKLMEPFLSTAFVHAQLDDKLAGWRGYGDDKENNETAGTAADLGSLVNGTRTEDELSIDDNSDVDFCEFRGKTIIYYSWGNQQGTEFLAEAVYDGTMASLLKAWFP